MIIIWTVFVVCFVPFLYIAFDYLRKRRKHKRYVDSLLLGYLLMDFGLLRESYLQEALEKHKELRLTRPVALTPPFGRFLAKCGYCSLEDVDRALDVQRAMRSGGPVSSAMNLASVAVKAKEGRDSNHEIEKWITSCSLGGN